MSDNPLGPDWWLASDGKWYPPESRHEPLPPPPLSVQVTDQREPPQRRVPWGLSGTIQGFLWAAAGVQVFVIVLGIIGRGIVADFQAGGGNYSDYELVIDNLIPALLGLTMWAALTIFILMIIWTRKCHRVAQSLTDEPIGYGLNWAVWAWLIPLGNAILPRLILRKVEIALESADTRITNLGQLGWVWWVSFFITTPVFIFWLRIDLSFYTYQTALQSFIWGIFASIGGATSSILGALYVRRLSRGLNSQIR